MTDTAIDARLVLAVDLGTSGCKCALVALDGSVRSWAFQPVALHVQGARAEQDPEAWWRALLMAANELLAADAALRRRVVAVCCSTQTEVTVCVDRAGQPIGRAISWLDARGAAAIARRARSKLFNIEGYAPLKLWRWLKLTGGAPSATGRDIAGHLAFVRDEMPEVYARTHKFLNALDFLNLRLTGRLCATQDSILTAWVTDNRDPRRIRYDASLLRLLGVEEDKLPEIVQSTDVIGCSPTSPRRSGCRPARSWSRALSTTRRWPWAPRWGTTRATCTSAPRRGWAPMCLA